MISPPIIWSPPMIMKTPTSVQNVPMTVPYALVAATAPDPRRWNRR